MCSAKWREVVTCVNEGVAGLEPSVSSPTKSGKNTAKNSIWEVIYVLMSIIN